MVVAEPQNAPELEGSEGREAVGGELREGTEPGGMIVILLLPLMTMLLRR
jgi:hypothetical protein